MRELNWLEKKKKEKREEVVEVFLFVEEKSLTFTYFLRAK